MSDSVDLRQGAFRDPMPDDAAAEKYAVESGLADLLDEVRTTSDGTFPPDLRDLARLHSVIRARKVTTVLEFGCGWSTLAMAHALEQNESELRGDSSAAALGANPFELHCVDDMPSYVEVAVARIPETLRRRVHSNVSTVSMTTFAGRICSEYAELPNVCADLVYIDGPSLFETRGDVAGISMANADRMPMACDLLKIEHFLVPGTLVLVDGRTANARFLASNLQRGWRYVHDPDADLSSFELVEPPLGVRNRRQIEHRLGAGWLEQVDG